MVRSGSTLAGPGAPGGRARGPRLAEEATPGPLIKTIFLGVLLLVQLEPTASSTAYSPDALNEELCPAGYYRDETTGACKACRQGEDYTNHSNNLPACNSCTDCGKYKLTKSPCTTTRNTECQCPPGTFEDRDSPEFCQTCTTSCDSGMVEESPCGPRSDRKCVHKESGTEATSKTPASPEPVTVNPSPTASLHPSSDLKNVYISVGVLPIVGVLVVVALVMVKYPGWRKILARVKNICPSRGQDPPHRDTDRTLRSLEAQDNDHNEILSSRNSPSTVDFEQQGDGDRQELLTGVTEEFPEERPAETERSLKRRRPLNPANGTDTIETIKQFFIQHQDVIPYTSWDKLMRLLGLTDNEIHVIKCRTQDPGDTLYEMITKWLNKMGREASINTLLDNLETLGERNAREKIEDYMVKSGKFIYQDDEADSTESFL